MFECHAWPEQAKLLVSVIWKLEPTFFFDNRSLKPVIWLVLAKLGTLTLMLTSYKVGGAV